jgi:flagellar export protein FliJ
MTKWAHSLIRLATYEVETLQKQMAEVSTRLSTAELRVAVLDAEYAVEKERARDDAQASGMMEAYTKGWKLRRAAAVATMEGLEIEEQAAREALGRAFEEQKKFEHVAELSRLSALAVEARRETAALDELALRRAIG